LDSGPITIGCSRKTNRRIVVLTSCW
jgi:hypothetical protein